MDKDPVIDLADLSYEDYATLLSEVDLIDQEAKAREVGH